MHVYCRLYDVINPTCTVHACVKHAVHAVVYLPPVRDRLYICMLHGADHSSRFFCGCRTIPAVLVLSILVLT